MTLGDGNYWSKKKTLIFGHFLRARISLDGALNEIAVYLSLSPYSGNLEIIFIQLNLRAITTYITNST